MSMPCLAQAATAEVEGFRIWSNKKKQNIEARLVKVFGEKNKAGKVIPMVTFQMKKTGKDVTFPVNLLSAAHLTELKQWLKRRPSGVPTPSAPYMWPREYNGGTSTKVNYIGLDEKRKAHLYRTKHFDFYIEEKLSNSTVSKCVAVFDSIVEALDALPMGLDTLTKEGKPRYQVILVASRDRYMQLGGIPNSGGFFSPGQNLTVIPFQSLGIVKKGKNWVFDGKNRSFDTLTHELTHHSTQHWRGMPPWFEEGLAEYMSTVPYQSGRFLFTNPGSAIGSGIRDYKKTTIANQIFAKGEFRMRPLQQLIATNRQQWNGSMKNQVLSLQNYSNSMILMYYLMHEDGSGDGDNLIQWMHAWRSAVNSGRRNEYDKLIKKHILRDRTYAELQADVKKAMSRKGLRITF